MAIDAGEAVVVGVNRFMEKGSGGVFAAKPAENPSRPLFQIDPEVERQQIDCVRAVRAGRSAGACRAALDAVSHAACEGGNLVPPIIAAVEAKATVGEISDTLRAVFGEYRETATL